ncbi:trypsin-like peptidase domain-containing protein [Kitasatospora sp. NPDC048407]|uniref:trypsin-like peptidase domain-containing protein n=1 Tax=Kitasatospora sp. NPDC048407 TaxID=3364051 RepID=UPI00371E17E1
MVGVDAPAGRASGCAIGGRLVLTSAHAVAGPSGGGAAAVGVRVRVFRPGEAGTFGAVVVWCGRDDAALLRVDDGPGWAEPQPVRWGRLVTDRTGVDCQAWGLPEHAQREGWAAQVEQSSGWLNPGSGYVADRYVMTVRGSAPGWDRPVPVWGGMSGGAVFCGPLLTGVVTAERAYTGNGRLVLSPA